MSADLHLPHQLAGANQTLTAQCHCKSVHFTIAVPTSALPLPAYLCHCHICRYIHGTLCIFHAPLPKEVEPEFISPSSLENSLTGYIHNEGAVSERFFCTTCGCHIGDRLHPDPETGRSSWVIAASIFTPQNENTFQIHAHYFTTSAPGDGFYSWLPSIPTLDYSHPAKDDGKDTVPSSPECLPQTDDQGNEVLLAQCHCAGVRFTLPRPSEEEQNDPFFSRFLSRVDPSKRVACVCVCKDCRLVDGTHAVGWTFAPLASLQPAINADFNNHGTLKAYRSSDKVTRAFCGKCGATVFYTIDDEERAPTEDKRIVDIAVGLFRAPEGILAENWLTWRTGRLAGAQSGLEYDKAFTEVLGKGLKEWGSQKYGEATNFNIPHDE